VTTIAFRAGILCSDSLVTSNGMRDGRKQKICRVGRVLVAGAGSSAMCLRFQEWVRKGMKGSAPTDDNDEANGLIIAPGTPDPLMLVFGTVGCWPVHAPFVALGSGGPFAMGAMQAGASAEEAVRAAIQLDVYSGGDIQRLTL
jgi:20S proteasome alpha/beta subunit